MEETKKNTVIDVRLTFLTTLVLLASLSRLMPHPPNFAPLGAMALFGAAYYRKYFLAFLIPISSLWISDLLLNNVVYRHYFDHFVWISGASLFGYAAFALIAVAGRMILKKVSVASLVFAAPCASIIFFAVSNFGVWLTSGMYPHTSSGLLMCYTAGIPFFQYTLLGDMVYTALLFGLFEMAQGKFPALQRQGNM